MSYLGISIKEAINNANCGTNGWFLPAIQRPYVWGSRYENEIYICKLFDSILKGYPIGGLIVWNTNEEIPYREFISDYLPDEIPKLVDKGLHKRPDKWLIYDGQQRIQTLYSCLKYTFHGKILVYDLLFDLNNGNDPEETGFSFAEKNSDLEWNFIRMNELFAKQPDEEKRTYRKSILRLNENINDKEEELIENNIDILWDIFVKTETKSLAYFPIKTSNEKVVNEIFERLNTGGMALSLADILFSKIKSEHYDFEEKLQGCSKEIYNSTGKGYLFNAYNILQLIYLLVKKGVRIDPKKVKQNEIDVFKTTWDKLETPLQSFFTDYLWGQFKINNNSIIPRNLALLPIMVYFYEIYSKGYKFKNISGQNLKSINSYFIKSQINDWNLQSYIDNFSRLISEKSKGTNELFDFPIQEIEDFISEKKKRNIEIHEDTFVGYNWFVLKILTPERIYQFEPDIKGRFNPEIDHVFPRKLKNRNADYDNTVDIVWNMQPTKGEINGFKTNIHPKLFFTDKSTNAKGEKIVGSKYVNEYDFLFPTNSNNQIDFDDNIWEKPIEFINKRKEIMIDYLKTKYDITFKIEEKEE
ncbi:MAG: DUF262 domain-containing protein [Bacteroidetes bacterium]|jgi:hypothetical protein|nr:DUF262 domain-containing protein [Bacteroidota bacterium]MBT6684723.1 DUF262 domain-containing protein [Bacteroidota bacterium]MBT7143758.1 DUF262 domain-containing protein [Bacteroidota bacterium]MBT7492707.1 DUF262 domain-containing protein [Bacteroidota bacterium]